MDITIVTETCVFNLRVRAVIIRGDKVLMINSGRYYYPVGGRVNMGETTEGAVMREVQEETGFSLKVVRLTHIHENFFVYDGDGKERHEIIGYNE